MTGGATSKPRILASFLCSKARKSFTNHHHNVSTNDSTRDSLNNNTVPLTVHMHTPHTDVSTCNVQTDEVPRDLSALNRDAGDSSPLRRDVSSPFH